MFFALPLPQQAGAADLAWAGQRRRIPYAVGDRPMLNDGRGGCWPGSWPHGGGSRAGPWLTVHARSEPVGWFSVRKGRLSDGTGEGQIAGS